LIKKTNKIFNIFFSPSGYTCDTKAGRCNKGETVIPFYKKTAAKSTKCANDLPNCQNGI
jgi:hypothetical protein